MSLWEEMQFTIYMYMQVIFSFFKKYDSKRLNEYSTLIAIYHVLVHFCIFITMLKIFPTYTILFKQAFKKKIAEMLLNFLLF